MHVIVAGAGIGGLTTARALLGRGHRVTVLERADRLRTEGGAMTVWHNGAAALDRLGISFDGIGVRVDSLVLRSGAGRRVGAIDVAANTARLGAGATAIARADLLPHLHDGLPAGTVRFGTAVTGVSERDGQVLVAAAGEQVHGGDLLIGADGAHSAVRGLLHGQARTPTTGMASCLGTIPTPSWLGPEAGFTVGTEGDSGYMRVGGGRIMFWFDVPWTGEPIDKPLELLRERFARWGYPAPGLLELLTEDDLSVFPHHRVPVRRQWGRGRTTLVGDAAHAMPPHLAQGMNQGFEDISVLVDELGRLPVEQALRSYERIRYRKAKRASAVTTKAVVVGGPTLPAQSEFAFRLTSLLPDRAFTWLHRTLLKAFSNSL